MAEKNIEMNVKTATGYDQLYPKSKAEIITYDNTSSGLTADTTQEAIDELETMVPSQDEKDYWDSKYTASDANASTRGLIKYAQGTFAIDINGFSVDTTYADYPFRKAIAITGCTANHFADVAFDLATATSGKIAPVVQTYAGGLYVYSKEQNTEQIIGSYKISYNA